MSASQRGTAAGLPVVQPIVTQLPGIYQDGMFIRGFTGGLDEVLAPVVAHAAVNGSAFVAARLVARSAGR